MRLFWLALDSIGKSQLDVKKENQVVQSNSSSLSVSTIFHCSQPSIDILSANQWFTSIVKKQSWIASQRMANSFSTL